MLVHHPTSPSKPYVPWQHKVKMQLDELLAINNPDVRTRAEIAKLRARLGRVRAGLRPPTRKCSDTHCNNQLLMDYKYKQCAFCRARKLRYERHRAARKHSQ